MPMPRSMSKQEEPETDDLPTEAEQALFLIAELGALMKRTQIADWPKRQSELFRRRLIEITRKAARHFDD